MLRLRVCLRSRIADLHLHKNHGETGTQILLHQHQKPNADRDLSFQKSSITPCLRDRGMQRGSDGEQHPEQPSHHKEQETTSQLHRPNSGIWCLAQVQLARVFFSKRLFTYRYAQVSVLVQGKSSSQNHMEKNQSALRSLFEDLLPRAAAHRASKQP